jgi:hypothetical protein
MIGKKISSQGSRTQSPCDELITILVAVVVGRAQINFPAVSALPIYIYRVHLPEDSVISMHSGKSIMQACQSNSLLRMAPMIQEISVRDRLARSLALSGSGFERCGSATGLVGKKEPGD